MNHFYVKTCVVPGILLACATAHAEDAPAEKKWGAGVDIGLRTDDLRWNIANSNGVPNILSELTWKNVDSLYLSGHATFKDGNLNVRGDYGFGVITRGDNQDSDYFGNDRTEEFSRSYSKSNGDNVSDAKLGIGITIESLNSPAFQFTPWFGLSKHQQNLKMTRGTQIVPALGSEVLNGLNSGYDAEWTGPWVGLNARLQLLDSRFAIRANVELHWADYSGQGNWNLRECLDHPKSFSHTASGTGNIWNLSADFKFSTDLMLSLTAASSSWGTDPGTDTVHLPADFYTRRDDQGALVCLRETEVPPPQQQFFNFSTQLNDVNWSSMSYLLGLSMRL